MMCLRTLCMTLIMMIMSCFVPVYAATVAAVSTDRTVCEYELSAGGAGAVAIAGPRPMPVLGFYGVAAIPSSDSRKQVSDYANEHKLTPGMREAVRLVIAQIWFDEVAQQLVTEEIEKATRTYDPHAHGHDWMEGHFVKISEHLNIPVPRLSEAAAGAGAGAGVRPVAVARGGFTALGRTKKSFKEYLKYSKERLSSLIHSHLRTIFNQKYRTYYFDESGNPRRSYRSETEEYALKEPAAYSTVEGRVYRWELDVPADMPRFARNPGEAGQASQLFLKMSVNTTGGLGDVLFNNDDEALLDNVLEYVDKNIVIAAYAIRLIALSSRENYFIVEARRQIAQMWSMLEGYLCEWLIEEQTPAFKAKFGEDIVQLIMSRLGKHSSMCDIDVLEELVSLMDPVYCIPLENFAHFGKIIGQAFIDYERGQGPGFTDSEGDTHFKVIQALGFERAVFSTAGELRLAKEPNDDFRDVLLALFQPCDAGLFKLYNSHNVLKVMQAKFEAAYRSTVSLRTAKNPNYSYVMWNVERLRARADLPALQDTLTQGSTGSRISFNHDAGSAHERGRRSYIDGYRGSASVGSDESSPRSRRSHSLSGLAARRASKPRGRRHRAVLQDAASRLGRPPLSRIRTSTASQASIPGAAGASSSTPVARRGLPGAGAPQPVQPPTAGVVTLRVDNDRQAGDVVVRTSRPLWLRIISCGLCR